VTVFATGFVASASFDVFADVVNAASEGLIADLEPIFETVSAGIGGQNLSLGQM
jgi:hypothetical protein